MQTSVVARAKAATAGVAAWARSRYRAAADSITVLAARPARPGPASKRPRRRAVRPRKLSVALQGGGAHGAFTWGLLDRLLG